MDALEQAGCTKNYLIGGTDSSNDTSSTIIRMTTKCKVCPHCGLPSVGDDIAAVLPGKQRMLYEIVRDSGQVGVTVWQAIERLYASDPNGGPEHKSIISVMTKNINRKIDRFGIAIKSRGGPGAVYKLVGL